MKREHKFSLDFLLTQLFQLSDTPILFAIWLLLAAALFGVGWYLIENDFEEYGIFWLKTSVYGWSGLLIAVFGGVMAVSFWIMDRRRQVMELPTQRLSVIVKTVLFVFFCIPLTCMYSLLVLGSESIVETAHLNDHQYYLTRWHTWESSQGMSLYKCNEIGFKCDLICFGDIVSNGKVEFDFDEDRLDLVVDKAKGEVRVEYGSELQCLAKILSES